MKLSHLVAAVSLSVSGFALASAQKADANCEVKGKKVSVKDEAACTKKKGSWLPAAAAAAAPEAATAPAAEADAPAAAPVDAAVPSEGNVDHK